MKHRTETVDEAKVGGVDRMSQLAYSVGLPACGKQGCTRAAGHDEALPNHPGTLHVVASRHRFVILSVF